MSIAEMSVRKPVTGVMIFMALTVLGVFTFSRLKLDMFPDIEFPIVAVIATYQGAGPEAVEQLVARPIESALASVKNVEKVTSSSDQDNAIIIVKFAWGTDMDQAEQDVRKNLELYAEPALPDDVEKPMAFAFDPSMQPIAILAVNAPGTAAEARRIAKDEVAPYLARIPGVAAADPLGGSEREIQVRLNPEWLEAYGIPAARVTGALRGANVVIPGGKIELGREQINIATRAQFKTIEQMRDLVVGAKGTQPVLLKDVADVVDTFQEQTSVVRSDGVAAVMLAVRKQSDANTVQVAARVMKEVETLQKRLPPGVTVKPLFDQGEPVMAAISNLTSSAYLAILLTAIVLLVFLRSWRTSVIVLVAIPLSMLLTFAVMDFSSVTLNILSMAGLALAVGMLVDNSIVVLENIMQHLDAGEDQITASIKGTTEVAMPVTASTLTTIVVFAPILFVPGIAGQLFRDLSLTICISLTASLLISLTLVPIMSSLMVVAHRNKIERVIMWLTRWLDPLSNGYARFLALCLRHKGKTIFATFLASVGTFGLLPLMDIDFMAASDQSQIQLNVTTAPGSSLAATDQAFLRLEAIVKAEVPEAEVIVSRFGAGEGFMALMGQSANSGMLQVRLPGRSLRNRSQQQIEAVLRKKFEVVPGVEVRPQTMGLGASTGGDIEIKVFGEDLLAVGQYGQRLKLRLAQVKGAGDVKFSMEKGAPELRVELDREQIRLLGLSPAEVASTVSTYFLGTTASMYRDGGDEYKILVRAPREVRDDVDRLRALPIVLPSGTSVPLSMVATLHQVQGPTKIARENKRRYGSITLAAVNTPLATLTAGVQTALADVPPPQGVRTEIAGSAQDMQESFMALGIAFLVAVLLVYMVMASQFESLLEPFVILFAVPLALSGVVVALVATGTPMQVTALIGIILLVGVVVNNGIVLIDLVKVKREAGEDVTVAAVDAGRSRLRPILMTTLTTVLGMVPLAFEIGDGAEMWAPMARAVIGGMTLSTLLTLIVVPTLYVILAGFADRRTARKRAKAAPAVAAPASAPAS
jgi:HAE1 family hydrophobic/amphiphilic exporter-1